MWIATLVGILILLFWAATIIGSIALVIWAICSRIKEKKIEDVKHKKYKDY
jgi:hypothetical protein